MENEVRDPYEYEVDLRDYIKVIWEEKWLIALIFVIAVGAALAFSLSSTPKYRTGASLIITSPVADKLVNRFGKPQGLVDFTSEFDYEEVGLSDELLEAIITDLNLTTDSGKARSPNSLRNQMSISLALPGNSDTDTEKPVLHLDVKGSNRERIKEIADKWGELYLQRASKILSDEVARYHEMISGEYSQVQEDLQAKIEERIEARKDHNLQLLKIEANVLRDRYKDYYASLEPKRLDLEKKRAQLRTLTSILEDEPRYLFLDRSASPGNLSTENQTSEGGSSEETSDKEENDNGSEDEAIDARDRRVNKTFLSSKIDAELAVSSLEKEVDHLSSKLVEVKSSVNTTQATIDRVQLDLEELDREINQLKDKTDSLYSALEQARTASEENGTIRLLNDASSVKTLESVNTRQNVAVAGVLGLFVGVLVAFFKNYMEGYEEETEEEREDGETEDQE